MKVFRSTHCAILFAAAFGAAGVQAGTIAGTVTDALDQAVPGIKVCAMQRSASAAGSFLVSGCDETGPDGKYSLVASLFAGSFLVQIDEAHIQSSGLNFIPEYHTGDVVAMKLPSQVALLPVGAQDTATVDFKLDRGYRFGGRIRKDDSVTPIASVLVCLLNMSNPAQSPNRCFEVDANGVYQTLPMPAGSYTLFTYNDMGYVDTFHSGQPYYDPRAYDLTTPLPLVDSDVAQDFWLRPGYTISGTVRDFMNQPVSGSVICVDHWSQVGHVLLGCSRTVNGYFETPTLLWGGYLLYVPSTDSTIGTFHNGVVFDADEIDAVWPLVLTENLTDYDLAADKAVRFSGTVSRNTSDPASGATVCFYRQRGQQSSYDLHDCVLADAEGHYQSEAMAAGYYGVTAGVGVIQHVAHDGSPVPLPQDGAIAFANPITADTDKIVNLGFALPAAERIRYLDENVADFRELPDWPAQLRPKPPARLALILEEAALLADEVSAMPAGSMPSNDALDLAITVGAAFEVAIESLGSGIAVETRQIDAALASLANLIRMLDISDPNSFVTAQRQQTLRALGLRTLRSATDLRAEQTDAGAIASTTEALGAFFSSLLSQRIAFDWEFISPFDQYAAATASSTEAIARDMLAARGVTAGNDAGAITAALRTSPLALDEYLRATALPLDFVGNSRRNANLDFVRDDVILALGAYFEATADSLDPIWALPNTEDFEQPLQVMRNALVSAAMTQFQAEDANGQVHLATGAGMIPVVAGRVLLVSDLTPEGVIALPDGSVLAVHVGVAVQVVPAPLALGAFGNLLGATDGFMLGNDGSVRFMSSGKAVVATLSFQNLASAEGATGAAQLEPAADLASLAPDAVFRVRYSNGTSQTLAPFVGAPAFFTTLSDLGFAYYVDRATGVLTVNGLRLRPAYTVEAPDSADLAFHAQAAVASGLAFKPGDFNGDGKTDYKVITATSVQTVYGL